MRVRQQRDLNLGRAGVLLVAAELAHDLELALAASASWRPPQLGFLRPQQPAHREVRRRQCGGRVEVYAALPAGAEAGLRAAPRLSGWNISSGAHDRRCARACSCARSTAGTTAARPRRSSALFLREQLGADAVLRARPRRVLRLPGGAPDRLARRRTTSRRLAWPENSVRVRRAAERQRHRGDGRHRAAEPLEARTRAASSRSRARAAPSSSSRSAASSPTRRTRGRCPVTGSADGDLAEQLGLAPSAYEGPTGIVGVVHDACQEAGIPSASLWAAVPHYISVSPNPKAALALLSRLALLLDTRFDTTKLSQDAVSLRARGLARRLGRREDQPLRARAREPRRTSAPTTTPTRSPRRCSRAATTSPRRSSAISRSARRPARTAESAAPPARQGRRTITSPTVVRARTSTESAEGSGAPAAVSALLHLTEAGVDVEPGRRALANPDLDVARLGLEDDRAAHRFAQLDVAERRLRDDTGARQVDGDAAVGRVQARVAAGQRRPTCRRWSS